MKTHDTIIIGAGMAGLGCARNLFDKGYKDFAIITENIGGRVLPSPDGGVNYGAFYMRQDYEHIQKYAQRVKRIRPLRCRFFKNGKNVPYLCWNSLKHLPSLIKLFFFLRKYKINYQLFRKLSETRSQKKVMEDVPFFKKVYTTPAEVFVKELGCEYWAENFINPINWSTSFADIKDSTGACMGMISLPFIVPSYEFKFDMQKLTNGFNEKIHQGTVAKITYKKNAWEIEEKDDNTWSAKNVVLAVPIHIAEILIDIPEPKNAVRSGHMVHVKGKLKSPYNKGTYIFIDAPGLYMAVEPNDTVLFYAQDRSYNLDRYFEEYKIIAEIDWNPGFVLGTHLIEEDRGNGLLMIGSHNAPTMEDAFTTGIYAANKILGLAKD